VRQFGSENNNKSIKICQNIEINLMEFTTTFLKVVFWFAEKKMLWFCRMGRIHLSTNLEGENNPKINLSRIRF
jgi:hypothetical protein